MPNRLANESSPYLRQHADNPVDWWPWGADAFAEAKRTNKPLFVSIGYAACHWCHVMAHESFEDDDIARLMNEHFINIKVDREERPDVDAIFMNAIMVQGEGGGWPLSAFCLPDGRPYFLGTYFPPAPRFGRPSFPQLLTAMADAYRSRRSDAEDNALALVDGLARVDAHYRRGARDASPSALAASMIVTAGQQLAERADPRHGGLGGKPKFPSSSTHDLLGRAGRLSFGEPAKTAFIEWAKGMAEGGIYDHLGGGFARYSVDEKWLVPHFEKMLYDQAQLLSIYAAVVAQHGPFAARASEVIAETVAFLERELSDADGGLWSSLDADSDGEEGKFYVWTLDEVLTQLGKVNGLVFAQAYGVTSRGNFEDTPTCVLSRVSPRSSPHEEEQLADARRTLFEVRAHRNRPGTDDKVLAGWNGLAIAGLIAAWKATGQDRALALALRVASFLRERMTSAGIESGAARDARSADIESEAARDAKGADIESGAARDAKGQGITGASSITSIEGLSLARVFHHGATKSLEGTLEDYAFCAQAFFDLAEATGDRSWWDLGSRLIAVARERFVAEEDGVVIFYLSAAGDELLVHRPESHQDGAIPSGAAWFTMALLRLGLVAGDESALALAEKYLVQRLGGSVAPNAFANSALLAALDLYLHAKVLVVTDGPARDDLLTAARRAYAPTLCIAGPWASASILDGKTSKDGDARAFVCTGPTCAPPVSTAAALVPLVTTTSTAKLIET